MCGCVCVCSNSLSLSFVFRFSSTAREQSRRARVKKKEENSDRSLVLAHTLSRKIGVIFVCVSEWFWQLGKKQRKLFSSSVLTLNVYFFRTTKYCVISLFVWMMPFFFSPCRKYIDISNTSCVCFAHSLTLPKFLLVLSFIAIIIIIILI